MIASTISVSFIVLSKIEFFDTVGGAAARPVDFERLQFALEDHFRSLGKQCIVTPAAGGTLGVCFHAKLPGEQKFLKTHLPGARARANLAKEAQILLHLYRDVISLDVFEMRAPDGSMRLCLLMPELTALAAPMRPEEAAAISRECDKRLSRYCPEALASVANFDRYLTCARHALKTLLDLDLLENETATELRRLINLLEGYSADQPHRLCHGDFGPKNIMTIGTQPIVIDWEDAFWGIAGYDYLYWLTFMENRPFLRVAALGKTGHTPEVERAILALVITLKSFLAVRAGTYANHRLSIQSRLLEVLDLPI